MKIDFLFCYLDRIVGWRNPFHVTSKYIRFKSHEILIKFAFVKVLGIVTIFGTFGNFGIWHLAKRGPLRAMGPKNSPSGLDTWDGWVRLGCSRLRWILNYCNNVIVFPNVTLIFTSIKKFSSIIHKMISLLL